MLFVSKILLERSICVTGRTQKSVGETSALAETVRREVLDSGGKE